MRDKKPKRKDFCWNFKMGGNSLLGTVEVLENVGTVLPYHSAYRYWNLIRLPISTVIKNRKLQYRTEPTVGIHRFVCMTGRKRKFQDLYL
jgi:hypothetical protein